MANVYYTKTFDVSPGTRVGSQTIEDQFLLVEQGFDSVQSLTPRLAVTNTFTALQTFGGGVAIDTGTYTGVNNFTGGSITVSTQSPGTNNTTAASTAFVTAAVLVETNRATTAENLLAPKASPTFTGTVVLPSTTSIGSVTNTEIGYLGGVTSAIQTQLNAKAPINSPTFTGTVTIPSGASISGYAPLDSPTFTGTPAAPTVGTPTDNTTKVATTGFVQSALTAYAGTNLGLPAFTGSDANKSLRLNGAGTGYVWVLEASATETLTNKTITSPQYTIVALGNSGTSAQTLNASTASTYTLTATGNFTISFSGFNNGTTSYIQLLLTNGGAYTITWPTISWIKPDGTTTTSISTYLSSLTGRTALQTSGVDQFVFWSNDGGTTVYAKLV